jgi:hypothetical protein
MRSENPKEVKVGEFKQVKDGNFVTVEFPEPEYGVLAARNVEQFLRNMGRFPAPEPAPALRASADKDSADIGKSASKSKVDDARSKK